MLRKLLKYDLRSIQRLFWLLGGSVMALSLLGGLALRFMINNENDALFLMSLFAGFFLFLNFMAIIAFATIIQIMVYYRFYKNLFTDEGYLTFTLPVSRAKLLASKTLNALIWLFGSGAVVSVCILEFVLIAAPQELRELLSTIPISGWWLPYIPLVIFAALMLSWCTISLVQFCITTGAVIAKKHKLLAAFGIYYLISMISSFCWQIFAIMGSIALAGILDTAISELSAVEGRMLAAALILAVGSIAGCIAGTLHFLTLGHLERRLNLA